MSITEWAGEYIEGVAKYLENLRPADFNVAPASGHNLKYIRGLGHGVTAAAYLFNETDEAGVLVRQIAVKVAASPTRDESIRHELGILTLLQNARHIVNVIDIDQSRLNRPILAIEYLQFGSLYSLQERLHETEEQVPNRLIWSFFLCLTRAVVGMAYSTPWNRDFQGEEIPPQGVPRKLAHNDLHLGNILIGNHYPGEPEHEVAPILKLIDFGEARMEAIVRHGSEIGNASGIAQNILDVGNAMQDLVLGTLGLEPSAQDINIPGIPFFQSRVSSDLFDERLDPDLKTLISWCMAEDPTDRPSLRTLLNFCERALVMKTEAYYQANPAIARGDTDKEFLSFIQENILDPP